MKVKLLVGRASAEESHAPGDVIEVDEAEGARMVEAGQAVDVSPPKKSSAKA